VAIGACAVAGLALLLTFEIPLARSDAALHRAEVAARDGRFDLMLDAGPAAQRAYPFEYSRLLGEVAMVPSIAPGPRGFLFLQSEAAARAALPHSDRPHVIHLHLASLAALQGRYPEAQSELEATIRCSPTWFRPRWQLAYLLDQAGHHKEAAEQATAALQRWAGSFPEIAAEQTKIQRRQP